MAALHDDAVLKIGCLELPVGVPNQNNKEFCDDIGAMTLSE